MTQPSTPAAVLPLVARQRVAGQRTSVQGALALDLMQQATPPEPSAHPRTPPGADVVLVNPRTRVEVNRWATAFTQAVVEVVAGDRPVSQLVRWTTPDIHRELAHRARVVAQAGAHRAGQGRARQDAGTRPQVTSLRLCFTTTARVEICAVVRHGNRSRFLAGRIDRSGDRWRCTVLEFG